MLSERNRAVVLLLFQFSNLVVSFFTTFYIASCLESESYAVIAVTTILTSITLSFSNTGVESYIKRNLLYWRKKGLERYSKVITTNAIFYRWLIALLLQIPLYIYSLFLSITKFDGEYIIFFVVFGIFSSLTAMCTALNMVLQADNKFVLASLFTFVTTLVSKLAVLFIFLKYGFNVYIYSLSIAPIVLFFLQISKIREYFEVRLIMTPYRYLRLVKAKRFLLFSSYASFMFNYVDNFLVSLLLPASILGSYSLAKQVINIAKLAIDNILDPIMIKMVAVRDNIQQLCQRYKLIIKVRNGLLVAGFVCLVLYVILGETLLDVCRLGHHINIFQYVLFGIFGLLLALTMNVPFYINSVLDSEKDLFKLYMLTSLTNIFCSLIVFTILPYEYAMVNMILMNFIILSYLNLNIKKSVLYKIKTYINSGW